MRAELIHPLVVHFPLALLLTGAALRLAHFLLRRTRASQVTLVSAWILLLLGVCSAWIAVIAGEVAEDIVRNRLCMPEVLEHHKDLAYITATLFSIALLIDFFKAALKETFFANSSIVQGIMALLYIAATVILIFTGGYGADLVYEQGAAVERSCAHP